MLDDEARAEVSENFFAKPEYLAKVKQAAKSDSQEAVKKGIQLLFDIWQLCCNKVKVCPGKRSMIHANNPPPLSPPHLPPTSPPPLHDSCMIHGASPWETFHFVKGHWQLSRAFHNGHLPLNDLYNESTLFQRRSREMCNPRVTIKPLGFSIVSDRWGWPMGV